MTDPSDDARRTDADLDGHSVQELSDYLDRGRTPRDESIESSPACRMALKSMERARELGRSGHERAADEDTWVRGVMSHLGREARAGRRIPLETADRRVSAWITEGAVRGLVRAAGDQDPDVLTGRCVLAGDVSRAGARTAVRVDLGVRWGADVHAVADRARERIRDAVSTQAGLVVTAVDLTVEDLFAAPDEHTRHETEEAA